MAAGPGRLKYIFLKITYGIESTALHKDRNFRHWVLFNTRSPSEIAASIVLRDMDRLLAQDARLEARIRARRLALAMSLHPRLGRESEMGRLDAFILHVIKKEVQKISWKSGSRVYYFYTLSNNGVWTAVQSFRSLNLISGWSPKLGTAMDSLMNV